MVDSVGAGGVVLLVDGDALAVDVHSLAAALIWALEFRDAAERTVITAVVTS